jgi:hypothetical protein
MKFNSPETHGVQPEAHLQFSVDCWQFTGKPEVIHHRSLSDGQPRFTFLVRRPIGN